MSKALSVDLRERVVAAALSGIPHRAVAARFGVSAASVSRWRRLTRETGTPIPKALGGDRRSKRIEAQASRVLAVLAEQPDITIDEMRRALETQGHSFGHGTIHRFFRRHGLTRKKKTGHAEEQNRDDVKAAREAWFDTQPDLDPERLVFIDETWAKTNMARAHGRCPRGERLRMCVPWVMRESW